MKTKLLSLPPVRWLLGQAWFQHHARAFGQFQSEGGGRLAASVTYYGFLSFFPLLLLAVSVLGFVLAGTDSAQRTVQDALTSVLPPALLGDGGLELDALTSARKATGLLGLVGLLFSGTGWISTLRDSVHILFGDEPRKVNLVVGRLVDVLQLAAMGLIFLASLFVTAVVTKGTDWALGLLGAAGSTAGLVLVAVLGVVLALVADTALFLFVFAWMPRWHQPLRPVLRGAVLAAVGFEVLKSVGTYYVARTTSRGAAVYGAFAVVVGLLVWINLVAQVVLYAAAWTATDSRRQREAGEEPFPGDQAPDVRAAGAVGVV